MRVRFRIDGVLQEMMAPPFKFKAAIISRLKIMAELDIAERRVPQDGRIKIKVLNRTIDLRVSIAADDLRREDRDAYSRQEQPQHRSREARLRAAGDEGVRDRDRESLRHGAGHRPDRIGQDHHALLGAVADQHARGQHHDRRGPGRVQPGRHQPGAGQRGHRADVRRGAQGVPAPGPQHHHGRRNPRYRHRLDRGQGRAHRPPGALDAAHQRRAERDRPSDRHGDRAVPGRVLGEPGAGPASGAPHLHRLQAAGRAQRGDPARAAARRRRVAKAHEFHEGRRLRRLQQHRLPRAPGRLRGDVVCRTPLRDLVLDRASAAEIKRAAIVGGHADAAPRRAGEAEARDHDRRKKC